MGSIGYGEAQGFQAAHGLVVEVGDAARVEGDGLAPAVAGEQREVVVDEIEIGLEGAIARGQGARAQAARGEDQRRVPEFVLERGKLDFELAGDLGPQVQGVAGSGPLVERKVGPALLAGQGAVGGVVGDGHGRLLRGRYALGQLARMRSRTVAY